MASVSGSFNVVGGSGNYRVSIIECTIPLATVAYVDLIGQLANGSIPYTVTTASPINISYRMRVEDLITGTLFGETSCNPLVCTCVALDVSGITGTNEGLIYTSYNFTPSIALGSSPITHSWTVSGGATITGETSLTCTLVFPTAGTYTLTYSGSNPCGADTITKTIVISSSCTDPTPTVSLAASVSEICGTETASITATGCTGSVVWTDILGNPVTNFNSDNNVFIIDQNSSPKTLKAKCFNCNGSSSYSNIVGITYTGLCTSIGGIIGSSSC